MPRLPGQAAASDTGHVFEGTPPWFSGAGVLKPADTFWTDAAKAPQRNALAEAAARYDIDPQVFYNALLYSGRDPSTMTPESFSREGVGALGPVEMIRQIGEPGTARYRAQSFIPKFLADYQRQKHLPGVAEKFSPYSTPPGLLKQIADIAAGHLEERAAMKPSDRVYKGERLARFDPAQVRAQQALEDIAGATPANNAVHKSVLDSLQSLQRTKLIPGIKEYLDKGITSVSPEERALFRQSAMHDVVEPLQAKMRRDLLERILPQINTNRVMKGNLYGGGTDKLRERAIENYNRDAMEIALPHLFAAEQQGQQAGETQRHAQINAGQIIAPASVQAMGAHREVAQSTSEALRNKQLQELVAAEAGTSAGAVRQQQEQQALNIAAQNWEAEQAGLMDEVAQVGALVRGQQIPKMSTSTTPVAPTQSSESSLGKTLFGAGILGAIPKKTGGRVKLATGGLATSNYSNFRDSLSSGDFLNRILNGSLGGPSMASQAVQQDMMNQPPPPPPPAQPVGSVMNALPMPALEARAPEVPQGPLERGGQSAMNALEKMNQYRDQLNQQAASLDSGAQDVNPMLPFLAHTFIGAGASKNPNFGQSIAEGAQQGLGAFEQQHAANVRNKELSLNIKKGLLETYQKEHEHELAMQLKRDEIARKDKLDAEELRLKGITVGSSADTNKAHAEYYRAMAHKTLHPEESPQKGQNYTVPLVGAPESGSEKSLSEKQTVMLTPITSERKKRLEDLQKGYKANKEDKSIASNMLEDLDKVGYQGVGGESLAPELATLLAGDAAIHGKFEKDSAALQLARKDAMQGRVTNAALKLVEQSKPRHGVNKGTNKLVLAETVGNAIQKDIVMPFEIKCIESNIPDSVIDEAVAKWEQANPVSIKGKPVMPKGSPADYLPKEYKMYLGLGRPEESKGGLADMSDEELMKIANGG